MHKSYAYLKRVHKEFEIGDHVFLRVKPRKSFLEFGSCDELAPRDRGPFKVLDRIGPIAYMITFPTNMKAHNVFHTSFLKKYAHNHNHLIDWNVIQVEPEGEFQVEPMHIPDKKVTFLQNRAIGQVKVQWDHYGPKEATWELEDFMRLAHPFLFNSMEH